MTGRVRTRKAPGRSRVRIPMIVRDIALALLAAVCFVIGACLVIELIRRYCLWF